MKIIFLDIPSYPLPIAVRNTLTNKFYEILMFLYIFKNKEKVTSFFRDPSLYFSLAFFLF